MKKKNILLIAYYFPPIKAIGSTRPYYFAKNLIKKNWDVSVITTMSFKYLQNDSFLVKLKQIKYLYIPSFDLQVLKSIFQSRFQTNGKNESKMRNTSSKSKKTANRLFQKLRNSFPLNIAYEGGFLYVFFGLIWALYYMKKNNIKYIYSTYSPYSNHLIAYLIKLIYKDCYWIADFRDLPFGENDTEIFFKSFQMKMNELICKKADALVTISDGMKKSLLKYNKCIFTITNGLDIDMETLIEHQIKIKKGFNIVYTGMLYEGKRDATMVFKAVKLLLDRNKITNNIKLIYAGNDGHLWKKWAIEHSLEKYIEIKGPISRKSAIELQNQASINLMLTWATKKEKGILTGKLFEYLSTLNPIFCVINGIEDKEIENLFQSINCRKVFYNNETEELSNNLYKICKNYKYVYNFHELEKYTYPYLTNGLESIFLNKDLLSER